MRIAFMGTPEFAVPSLKALYEAGHETAVFTQPDRAKGRGYNVQFPPVKEYALSVGLPVFQFERIKRPEGVAAIREFAPELMVTAAFGQILSAEILSIPTHGCINVHGSLLPKYRGAAPIQAAIINGETVTGITTMLTDVGLDTGDMLMRREVEILPDETYGELYDRLADVGAEVLLETIERLLDGTLIRTPQDHSKATKCGTIKKEDALIDFSQPAAAVHNLIRGLNPQPTAYTYLDGKILKLWRTKLSDIEPMGEIGQCTADRKKGLFVRTGDGMLEITELQLQGGKRMDAKTYLNGKNLNGCRLG